MNFYEHQDRANSKTKFIVFLFVVAVIFIVALVTIPIGFATEWEPIAVSVSALACLLIVGVSSLVKLKQLGGGGAAVAEMLGGTALQRTGASKHEKRVQNVVEEMAIASGMPVPPVYIIDDDSINAFAAGWTPDDAVIGVTNGCIKELNRDELQGVVAHEFSHISHGDMRINIRLIGVIFGIMVLGITGWVLARYIGPAVLRTSSRSRSKEGAGGAGVGLAIIVFGLFLALCGIVGTFFSRLIQAAVSRQREFLADASAVQYTRNPSGIGGALCKIGGFTPLSSAHADASQCNHMFFSQAMNAMFASHPPITERISRVEGIDVSSLPKIQAGFSVNVGVDSGKPVSGFSSSVVVGSIATAGSVQDDRIQTAVSTLNKINPAIKSALNSGWSARLVVYALVSNKNNKKHQQDIAEMLGVTELAEYRSLEDLVIMQDPSTRLPMVDLAAPALRQLSDKQKEKFVGTLLSLVKSDGIVERFEWVLVCVVKKHLFGGKKKQTSGSSMRGLSLEASSVLGSLSYLGATTQEQAEGAFKKSIEFLGLDETRIPKPKDCNICVLEKSLQKLCSMKFTEKERLLNACVECISHDGKTTVSEAETLRAIGDMLDCPIPIIG